MTIKQKYVIIYADKSKGEKIMKKIEILKMNGELEKHQIVTIADAYSNEFFKGERFVARAITYLSIHKNSSKIFNADLNNLFTNKEQLEKFFKKYYFPLFIKEVMVKLEIQGAFAEEYEIVPAKEVDLKEVF